MAKKQKRRVVRKQPVSIISDEITIPNHSGDHSAGTTKTPVSDLDIANKKYVDDNALDADIIVVFDGAVSTLNGNVLILQ